MQTILRALQKLLKLFKDRNIPYMIIGGFALPAYGRIRATVDLDVAVAIKTKGELERLLKWLRKAGFEAPISSIENPLLVLVDRREQVEIELWLRPDGIIFDQETLRRRWKAKLNENISAWIISPEDFIVNKLARPDRGVNDEKDVKSVLAMQENRLDNEYLESRARDAGVFEVLESIKAAGS